MIIYIYLLLNTEIEFSNFVFVSTPTKNIINGKEE